MQGRNVGVKLRARVAFGVGVVCVILIGIRFLLANGPLVRVPRTSTAATCSILQICKIRAATGERANFAEFTQAADYMLLSMSARFASYSSLVINPRL
jgi:hypothetical protein